MTDSSNSAQASLAVLSNNRAELLKLILEQQSRQRQRITPHPRAMVAGATHAPCSWAQRRFWLIDQAEGGSAGYQVPLTVRLRGQLDEAALRQALIALVERHEILRTTFVAANGEPVQEIASHGSFSLQTFDLTGRALAEQHVRSHQSEEVHQLFDLRTGPLIRGRLLRLAPLEHVLLLNIHHILLDGWSKGVLIREIAELYSAFHEGRAPALAALPVQYADYAHWHRKQWSDAVMLEKKLPYWRARLQGVKGDLPLPVDHEWPAVRSHRGEGVPVVLDCALVTRVKTLAQQQDVTPFMVLFSAWSILLSRLTRQADVVVGTPVANRQRAEIEGLIGLFVNPVTLRVTVREDMRLRDLLRHVKEVTRGAYDHQDVPFEKVVEALNPAASVSRTPLFRVVFVMHTEPAGQWQLSGLDTSIEEEVDEPAMIDLLLSLEVQGEALAGRIYYAAELFERRTMQRWAECFRCLLHEMLVHDGARVSDLATLRERAELIATR